MMTHVLVEYVFRDMADGAFWIDLIVDREPCGSLGPFDNEAERERVHDDLLQKMRSMGATDIPTRPQ